MNNPSTDDCKETINLDSKRHGGFSLVSYAVEFSDRLGYPKDQKNKILEDLICAPSFDDMIVVFKHNFNHVVSIHCWNNK